MQLEENLEIASQAPMRAKFRKIVQEYQLSTMSNLSPVLYRDQACPFRIIDNKCEFERNTMHLIIER